MCDVVISGAPPDAAAVGVFFDRTSPEARRARFRTAVSELPIAELRGLTRTSADRLNIYALAANSGDVVGVASAFLGTRMTAEVAVWVIDRCQRRGIGSRLLTVLRTELIWAGVHVACGLVEPANGAAIAMSKKIAPNAALWRNGPELWVSANLSEPTSMCDHGAVGLIVAT